MWGETTRVENRGETTRGETTRGDVLGAKRLVTIWDPHTDKLQEELEKVQNRVTRFVTRNYVYETGSMTGILKQLKWESLKKRRKFHCGIL